MKTISAAQGRSVAAPQKNVSPYADPAHENPAIEQALSRLNGLYPKVIDLSLGRLERLLRKLGDPHRHLPPVFHVAGTNGKGSTLAFLAAVLKAAGHSAHSFTSPHLVRFNERIVLCGREIGDEPLLSLLEEVERANAGDEITFFEITTAAAFLAYARTPADALLLETGLGGRFDASNVVSSPLVTMISRISFDHMQFLGDTLEKIAFEKAGIMKPGVPCVIGAQHDEAVRQVFRQKAQEAGCLLYEYGRDWRVEERSHDGGFLYHGGRFGTLELPAPSLTGAHQILNAGLALAALEQQDRLAIPKTAFASGMRAAVWPARLQRLTRGPLADLSPPGSELWLDGAHNDSGAEVLAQQLRRWKEGDGMAIDLVACLLPKKDAEAFAAPFANLVDTVSTIDLPGRTQSLPAEELAAIFRAEGTAAARAHPSLESAVQASSLQERQPRRIVIAGSLYLAGHILKDNG